MTANTESKASMVDLFRNRVVRTILLSVFFLQIGIWVRNYSILLFVMEKTGGHDPVAVSLIYVAEYAPIFLFSFIGGTFADRWRPKRTMVWCDLLSAVSVFAVLLTLVFGSWKAIFFATLVSSILSQFSQPSGMKLFKLHVPETLIQMGMSMYQTIFALFMILGPVIGTFVYQHYGIDIAIGAMGIAFLLSAVVLLLLPPDRTHEQREEKTIWEEMKAGFRYVLQSRTLTLLGGCFAAAGLAIGLIQPLSVFIVTERLGLPKEQLQWLMAANGAAMILGGILVMGLAKKVSPLKLLMIGMTMSAFGFLVMGLSGQLWLTLTAQFIGGLAMPCISIGINTMILKNTESDFVGRVNGILNPVFMGTMILTMSVSGWLKSVFSLMAMFEAATVLFIVGVIIMLPLLKVPAAQRE
ncbi:MFS transporter [Brevibacillus sp. B_LB10_24]|uniref:MFS transporter n=1 Tax=Brevibacillus sp. B_LB10_24 TaxID=3380645 RepID=UPI0038BB07EF